MKKDYVLMKGNEAMGEAAIIAGCRHYFAYPITPQNEVPAYMARRLLEVGGTFLQAESELAAISMVMGAAAGGVRVMTSTSSPGMSLKQEGISYLAGAELPCVVANIMRGGPGLGGIAGAQGDYFQATRGGGNGDYRTVVLAPGSAQELADMTVEAFDIADRWRIPVIILGDGYLGQVSEPLVLPKPTKLHFEKNWTLTGAKGRKKRVVASLHLIPETALEDHNLHLQEKYDEITKNLRSYESYETQDADWIIVAYGTSSRIARKAVNSLRAEGIKVGLFRPKALWPFPGRELRAMTVGIKRVLTVEMSLGQLVEDVQLSCGPNTEVELYGRAGGAIPSLDDIIGRIKAYERNDASHTHVQAS